MIYTALLIGLAGVLFGSFVNALVWRLKENRDWVKERSECIDCHHVLAPKDLVPVFSWLALRGKCRYCKRPISIQYPIVELVVGVLFGLSFFFWPYDLSMWPGIALLGLWLFSVVLLAALFIYDLKWFILPDKLVFTLIGVGVIYALIRGIFIDMDGAGDIAITMFLSLLPITGIYLALFLISKGSWVGFGDVKLGIFLGLVLGWEGALLCLFLANVIGTLIVVPGLLSGRLGRKTQVPFGPMLIAGFFIAGLFGARIIDAYIGSISLTGY